MYVASFQLVVVSYYGYFQVLLKCLALLLWGITNRGEGKILTLERVLLVYLVLLHWRYQMVAWHEGKGLQLGLQVHLYCHYPPRHQNLLYASMMLPVCWQGGLDYLGAKNSYLLD